MLNQTIELAQEVTAIQIPSGDSLVLAPGSRVQVTQMLGSSCTLATEQYGLVRISRTDCDALGISETGAPPADSKLSDDASLEEKIWETLECIYDPEIPVDIVNLGLIYDVIVTKLENGLHHVAIKMTLTAPGCGMGPHMMEEAKMRVEALDGVESTDVEMIWDPPWNQHMISEEGKMKLGLI